MFWKTSLACSFCGKKRSQITTLIAGPRVHICSECVKRYASQRIDQEIVARVDKRSSLSGQALTCSFCVKPSNEVSRMMRGDEATICEHCVEICGEILRTLEQGKSGR